MTKVQTPPGPFGIVLAAGASTRFGRPKQVAVFRNETLLARAHKTASALFGNRHLFVAGAHLAPVIKDLLNNRSNVVVNPDWANGPGASLAHAVKMLPAHCTGFLVWHADQPLISSADLSTILAVATARPTDCACASYEKTIGVPAYFPQRLFGRLTALSPEHGAKQLLIEEKQTTRIPMPAAAFDVDFPADLQAIAAANPAADDGSSIDR
ncbi:MAG: nucleotidyltransferase family protein [Pseudomonadota bacterium]